MFTDADAASHPGPRLGPETLSPLEPGDPKMGRGQCTETRAMLGRDKDWGVPSWSGRPLRGGLGLRPGLGGGCKEPRRGPGDREKLRRPSQTQRLGGLHACLGGREEARAGRGPGGAATYTLSRSVLQENQGPAPASSGSPKDSPAHEVAGGGRGAYTRFDVPPPRVRRSWPSFRGGRAGRGLPHRGWGSGGVGRALTPAGPPTALLLHRYVVARVIWADMLSIAVTYFITLCLFPGLESEIRHCVLGEWLPILLMAVFNLSDFVGKVGAPRPARGGCHRGRAADSQGRLRSHGEGQALSGRCSWPLGAEGESRAVAPSQTTAVESGLRGRPRPALCPRGRCRLRSSWLLGL